MRQYRKTLTQLQTMLDLMTGLRKVRENIPVKETISTVFSERRDFVRLFFPSNAYPAHGLPFLAVRSLVSAYPYTPVNFLSVADVHSLNIFPPPDTPSKRLSATSKTR